MQFESTRCAISGSKVIEKLREDSYKRTHCIYWIFDRYSGGALIPGAKNANSRSANSRYFQSYIWCANEFSHFFTHINMFKMMFQNTKTKKLRDLTWNRNFFSRICQLSAEFGVPGTIHRSAKNQRFIRFFVDNFASNQYFSANNQVFRTYSMRSFIWDMNQRSSSSIKNRELSDRELAEPGISAPPLQSSFHKLIKSIVYCF